MYMNFKPYKSFFSEEKPVPTSVLLKKAIKELSKLKKRLLTLHEEDEENVDKTEVISDVIDQVEEVITDVIDTLGATDPAVNTLIDTVQDLEADVVDVDTEDVLDSDVEEIDFVDEEI